MNKASSHLQCRIDAEQLDDLSRQAASAPRRRMHLTIHSDGEDPVQRLFIAVEPGTYIQPHRHNAPPRAETFLLLRGSMDLITFNDTGSVLERHALAPDSTCLADIAPGAWHSYDCHAPGTVALEIKQGPYRPAAPGERPDWAPAEGDAGCERYLQWMTTAGVGASGPRRVG